MEQDHVISQTPSSSRPSRYFGIKIIKTKFQFKFAFVVFIFMACSAFIMWLQGHIAVSRMVDSGMVSSEDVIMQLNLVNDIVAKTAYLSLALVFGLAILFSFLIAGPIYRFEKTLEAMRDGDLTAKVHLRKYDEFKEVADLFTQALSSLRVKLKMERDGLNQKIQKMEAVSEKLKNSGQTEQANALDQAIFELRNNPPQIKI